MVSYGLRPQSPQPNKHMFDQYLKKNGSLHFTPDELRVLEKLFQLKDKNLISSYELYISDKDEVEFLDTLTYIIKIHKDRFAEDSQDGTKDKEYSQSERSRISSIQRSGDELFEIFSVCTLPNADSVSDAGTGNKDTQETKKISNKTLGFQKESIERSERSDPNGSRFFGVTSDFNSQSGTGEKLKTSSLSIPNAITEAKVKDESSPQNGSGSGSKTLENSSKFDSLQQKNNDQQLPTMTQDSQTGQFHLSVPQAKKAIDPGAFSFYKKTPVQAQLEPTTQIVQSSAPINIQIEAAKEDRSVNNQNEFSGFGFMDDGFEKNSAAPSGHFGTFNPRRKQDDSQKNSVSDNGGFAPVIRNFSENFAQNEAPNFGNSSSIKVEITDVRAHTPPPNPAPERIDYMAISEGHMSFNPSVLKILQNKQKQPPTIEEHKDEGELSASPGKNTAKKTINQSISENCMDSPIRERADSMKQFDIKPIATAECSPARSKTHYESPKSHQRNKGYLSQILRFVLQHDGADPKLAKLCSDIVATADTGASSVTSFPADMFQFSKNKFMKSLDNYVQPILVEAIVERGGDFNRPLNKYNKDGNMEDLVQELMRMTEENEEIVKEGSKLREVGLCL